jgi:hypothetical protein
VRGLSAARSDGSLVGTQLFVPKLPGKDVTQQADISALLNEQTTSSLYLCVELHLLAQIDRAVQHEQLEPIIIRSMSMRFPILSSSARADFNSVFLTFRPSTTPADNVIEPGSLFRSVSRFRFPEIRQVDMQIPEHPEDRPDREIVVDRIESTTQSRMLPSAAHC